MKRKELLSLPVAPPPDLQIAPEVQEEVRTSSGHTYNKRIRQHMFTVRRLEQPEQVLETTVYNADGTWIFRTWQTADGLCAQNADAPEKPSRSTLASRFSDTYHLRFFGDAESARAVQAWTGQEGDVMPLVMASQQKIRDAQRIASHVARQQKIDAWCADVPELPEALGAWINDHVLHHVLLYRYSRKSTTSGYCTHCRQIVSGVRGARHRRKGVCPSCGHAVEMIAQGRFTVGMVDSSDIAVLGKPGDAGHGAYCIRGIHVTHIIPGASKGLMDGYETKLTFVDTERLFLSRELGMLKDFEYEISYFKEDECRTRRWREGDARDVSAWLFPENLPELLRDTTMRYIPFEPLCKQLGANSVISTLHFCGRNPGLEHLLKHGLTRLAANLVQNKYSVQEIKANTPGVREMLGVTRPELPVLREIDPSVAEFRTYNVFRERGCATPAMFERLRRMEISESAHTLRYVMQYAAPSEMRDYIEREQSTIVEGTVTCRELLVDYADYLREAKTLGLDLRQRRNLFPQDIQERHAQTAAEVAALKDAERIKRRAHKFKQARNRAETLRWEDEKLGLVIRPVGDEKELIAEGKALHHCVASYVERIADGKCFILLIRRKDAPEKPFFTCEVDPESKGIRQCRTLQNRSYTTEPTVEKFLKKWAEAMKRAE